MLTQVVLVMEWPIDGLGLMVYREGEIGGPRNHLQDGRIVGGIARAGALRERPKVGYENNRDSGSVIAFEGANDRMPSIFFVLVSRFFWQSGVLEAAARLGAER